MKHFLLCLLFGLIASAPAWAAKRVVEVNVPGHVLPGSPTSISVSASTDAGKGEQIGFLHAEYSLDGGGSWTAFCYEASVGPSAVRATTVTAGPSGSVLMVRARVAFRGGVAGDVDFNGAAIRWEDHWHNWAEPPAKSVSVKVASR